MCCQEFIGTRASKPLASRTLKGSPTEPLRLHHAVKGSATSTGFTGGLECALLSLSSIEEPLADDDLLLAIEWLGVDEPYRQSPAGGGVRQAERSAVCRVVTLCSGAEAWR